MKQLGVEMIPAYSPQARGRSERMFSTHQERLPKELAKAGISDMKTANQYLDDVYLSRFNNEFKQRPMEKGSAFIPWGGNPIEEILCEQFQRKVGNDNCVRFERLILQIPADQYRCHYVKATVKVHQYSNGKLALFHGPRKLAVYNSKGELVEHIAA